MNTYNISLIPGDGICQTPSGGCSLYAAIMESNGRSSSYSDSVLNIDFNLSSPVINTNTGAGYIPTSVYPLNIDDSPSDRTIQSEEFSSIINFPDFLALFF